MNLPADRILLALTGDPRVREDEGFNVILGELAQRTPVRHFYIAYTQGRLVR